MDAAFWTSSSFQVGLLGALSINAFGAALGALIGGPLSDKFGRKLIYTYDMLVYMVGNGSWSCLPLTSQCYWQDFS